MYKEIFGNLEYEDLTKLSLCSDLNYFRQISQKIEEFPGQDSFNKKFENGWELDGKDFEEEEDVQFYSNNEVNEDQEEILGMKSLDGLNLDDDNENMIDKLNNDQVDGNTEFKPDVTMINYIQNLGYGTKRDYDFIPKIPGNLLSKIFSGSDNPIKKISKKTNTGELTKIVFSIENELKREDIFYNAKENKKKIINDIRVDSSNRKILQRVKKMKILCKYELDL